MPPRERVTPEAAQTPPDANLEALKQQADAAEAAAKAAEEQAKEQEKQAKAQEKLSGPGEYKVLAAGLVIKLDEEGKRSQRYVQGEPVTLKDFNDPDRLLRLGAVGHKDAPVGLTAGQACSNANLAAGVRSNLNLRPAEDGQLPAAPDESDPHNEGR